MSDSSVGEVNGGNRKSTIELATLVEPFKPKRLSKRVTPESNDHNSKSSSAGGSTTGESTDDVASVVSQLSQIIVEQERKLKLERQSNDKIGVPQPSGEHDRAQPDKGLPEICVTNDRGEETSQESFKSKTRSKSTHCHVEIPKDDCNIPISLRRNESSGFLPERGNLRGLESVRQKQHAMRNRSNTAGNIDAKNLPGRSGELILNIKRAAWKLSDFDQNFNISSASMQDLVNPEFAKDLNYDRVESDSETSEYLQQQDKFRARKSTGSNNLLIQASKKAQANSTQFSNELHSPKKESSPTLHLNLTTNDLDYRDLSRRRSSAALSINSFASTIDSIYRRRKKKKHQKSEEKKDHDEDYDENQAKPCFLYNRRRIRETVIKNVPVFDWLPNYKTSDLSGDLMAGLVVAVLNISTSLSAAIVAETELSVAFRSSIINCFVYSILCSSKHNSFGSWSIMSQLLLISVQSALNDEIILDRINFDKDLDTKSYEKWHLEIMIMFTFLIGFVQMVCGFLKLGNLLSSFIPEALCSSMIAATAISMGSGQLANMFGTSNKVLWQIETNSTSELLLTHFDSAPVDITDVFAGLFIWVKQIMLIMKHYEQINTTCAIISLISLATLFLNTYVIQTQLERLFKRKILIPFEMVLLIIMIIVSYQLDLANNYNVPTSSPIELQIPKPSLPDLRLIRELWDRSLATALISYTLVYVMAKTYSNKFNYEVDYNQELVACGAGNLIGGLFDALPATASLSRTSAQAEAGGKTQLASLFNCLLLVATIQLFGHHVAVLPTCLMGTCLFFGFARMSTKVTEVFLYWRVCKVDFAIWMVTFIAILATDLINGFLYGFIFSILTMLYRAQNRRCYMLGSIESSDVYVPLVKYPKAREVEGIKIFQFCGPIHYVCADLYERLLRQKTRVDVKQVLLDNLQSSNREANDANSGRRKKLPSHIILDFSMISFIDSAGIHIVEKIIEDYKRINIEILIASLASHVAAIVKHEPSLWETHKQRFYVTLTDAVHCAIRDRQQTRDINMIDKQAQQV